MAKSAEYNKRQRAIRRGNTNPFSSGRAKRASTNPRSNAAIVRTRRGARLRPAT